jgi:hypothetical protein
VWRSGSLTIVAPEHDAARFEQRQDVVEHERLLGHPARQAVQYVAEPDRPERPGRELDRFQRVRGGGGRPVAGNPRGGVRQHLFVGVEQGDAGAATGNRHLSR